MTLTFMALSAFADAMESVINISANPIIIIIIITTNVCLQGTNSHKGSPRAPLGKDLKVCLKKFVIGFRAA